MKAADNSYISNGPTPPKVPEFEPLSTTGDETTEDPGGYLEPCRIQVDDCYCEIDDPSLSNIEGSMVDSEYLLGKHNTSSPIDVDKYMIRGPNRLSAISNDKPFSESEYSDVELFRMTDKERYLSEYEQSQKEKTESEQNLVNNLLNDSTGTSSLKKKKILSSSSSSNSIAKDSTSMNDLNKDSSSNTSKHSLYLSTPNIKYKPGGDNENNRTLNKDSVCQRSMPSLNQDIPEHVAVEKLKRALSSNDDGLIQLTHGKKIDPRLSMDTEKALKAHNYRLYSSDC